MYKFMCFSFGIRATWLTSIKTRRISATKSFPRTFNNCKCWTLIASRVEETRKRITHDRWLLFSIYSASFGFKVYTASKVLSIDQVIAF
jgi:hypothetical protein